MMCEVEIGRGNVVVVVMRRIIMRGCRNMLFFGGSGKGEGEVERLVRV